MMTWEGLTLMRNNNSSGEGTSAVPGEVHHTADRRHHPAGLGHGHPGGGSLRLLGQQEGAGGAQEM